MKWYKFEVDKFLDEALRLSDAQELAYRRLMDAYYVTEKPLPLDMNELLQLTGVTPDDTLYVLDFLFHKTPDGWRDPNIDMAIAKHQHQRKTNQTQGKRGGRPKKSTNP
jgi:hypothetical protein